MKNDPILMALRVALGRLAIFVVSSLLITISLWIWIIVVALDRPASQVWAFMTAAFRPSINPEVTVLGSLCAAVGCLTVALAFQLAASWWRRPRVLHVRGTQLIAPRGTRGRS